MGGCKTVGAFRPPFPVLLPLQEMLQVKVLRFKNVALGLFTAGLSLHD